MRAKALNPRRGRFAVLLAAGMVSYSLAPSLAVGSSYGRLAGTVSDNFGNPLMGASVLVLGPMLIPTSDVGNQAKRAITDAKGKFLVGHLIPGWYSLQVISPTRLPAHQNGVRVEAGQTSTLQFVLGDVFAPLRFHISSEDVTSLGEDWKWVLRTSSATRPILRLLPQTAGGVLNSEEPPLQADRYLLGMLPGSSSLDPQVWDAGARSVFAYLHSLSEDADLLVVGSIAANGSLTSSAGAEFRKSMANGDRQGFSLVVHQLGYGSGIATLNGGGGASESFARGLAASYSGTHEISPSLTLTAGMEVDYLEALRAAMIAQPRLLLVYSLSDSTSVAFKVGPNPAEGSTPLVERVGMLDSFPLMSMRAYRPELEHSNHSEIALDRRLNRSARLELAVYRDAVKNAVVWGSANHGAANWFAGNYVVNPSVGGIFLNAGDYGSSGYRVAYEQRLGSHVDALLAYQAGDALSVRGMAERAPEGSLQGQLEPARSDSLCGRVSARIPASRTQVISSYEWVQRGRVTPVDPVGQADMQMQPYFDVQVRQPLPALAFLPAHIEAVADFQNLLAQGYSPLTRSSEAALLLSSTYKSIRGGFSVEF